jgi:hypothetical protein
MKQTAVEWLQAEIDNKDMGEIPMWVYEFIEQAKAMEKEQIENAYGDGLNAHRTNFCNREEYFNKIYKTI